MVSSLPRPVLFALVGVVGVIGLFMFTRRAPETSGTSSPAPARALAPAADSGSQATSPGASSSTSAPGSVAQSPSTTKQASPPATGTDKRPAKRGLPPRVEQALDAHKAVVLLFWNAKGVDDRSVKSSVDRLSHRNGKVAIFSDGIRNVARYSRISTSLQVTQTPAIVFVNPKGEAEVQTGYLDFETINQYVTNALQR